MRMQMKKGREGGRDSGGLRGGGVSVIEGFVEGMDSWAGKKD
jgi:hypothetical protein